MKAPNSVCVYCGSSSRVADVHKDAAHMLGDGLARRGIQLVYGGGRVGLMGIAADAALAAGGHVVGIIPGHIQAAEIERMRRLMETTLARHTGKDAEQIRKDTDRDKILTAAEAVEYGLIDNVLEYRKLSAQK